jgi:UDP-N-acetyl-D-glucosamine/UDP-N-acetyl-D-galactosamine dehydrogenase
VASRILMMGLTFKENCPDVRNTRVIDVISELQAMNARVDVWDPWVDRRSARAEFGLDLLEAPPASGSYDAVLLAVPHREFTGMGAAAVRALGREDAVFFDLKGAFGRDESDGRL